MYPADNRFSESLPMDNINPPMYANSLRNPSMEMNGGRPSYYENSYYDKTTPMMQSSSMYDYMNQPPPMMPMNQAIDPRYSSWRQPSQNRAPVLPFYDRQTMNESYIPTKPQMPNISYQDHYPQSHDHMRSPAQMNLLQKISFLIKPQMPQLRKIMVKVLKSSKSYKSQHSKRQKSRERERRQRSRSHQKKKPLNSSRGEWVCSKCSFLNFDWRDKCKKCSESKPFSSSTGKNFVPSPDDWKCNKCSNLNYARRHQCNRCGQPKKISA